MAQSKFITRCEDRGFIHQCTNQSMLDAACLNSEKNTKPLIAYIGFDCTAPSLHVGSLMQIMILRHFQQCGHKPIILLGGGTTKVGDPSGKDKSRQLLDDAAIKTNKQSLKKVFETFLKFGEGATDAITVDNADWLDGLNYIEFLRDYGRHFSVNQMLTMESVKQRLDRESHLSFLEFNYMLLQAYDFFELKKRYDCRLQIGGSDQWGNIVMGTDLVRRLSSDTLIKNDTVEHYPCLGLTTPLLTTAAGAKMGKTADGAVWLDPELLSAYDYWQFWRNCDDADVVRFLKLFTELPMDEIARLGALEGADINNAKKTLATEATAMLHGREAAQKATETAHQAFALGQAAADLPTVTLSLTETGDSLPAFKLFQLAFESSGAEARRLIKGGGAKIDDAKVTDENQSVAFASDSEPLKLSSGKKKHVLVKLTA